MLEACGVMPLADPSVFVAFGQRVLLTHGDALCLADLDYQAFRCQVRSAEWQQQFLAQPLAARRAQAQAMRRISAECKAAQQPADWVDVDREAALGWLRAADAKVMVHGHTHQPASHPLAPGFVRHVLSDWELDHGERAEVLRWQAGGFERLTPAEACAR
jgi:UDP-2,3-diacylglucosamine hydrolase